MSNYNRIILMGRLTRDVEIRHMGNNTAVANFGMAVNRKQKERDDEVLYIDCTAFGRTAEVASQYLGKGDPVHVDGRLTLDQWDDKKTGERKTRHKVVVDSLQLMGGTGGKPKNAPNMNYQSSSGFTEVSNEIDDIPF